VSGALVREEKDVQKPVYYVCHAMNDPQMRYQRLKKLVPETSVLCLSRHERPSDEISKAGKVGVGSLHNLKEVQTLLSNLPDHSPDQALLEDHHGKSGANQKDIKMGFRAQVLRTQIEPRTSIKGQVLADFIVDFTPGTTEYAN